MEKQLDSPIGPWPAHAKSDGGSSLYKNRAQTHNEVIVVCTKYYCHYCIVSIRGLDEKPAMSSMTLNDDDKTK